MLHNCAVKQQSISFSTFVRTLRTNTPSTYCCMYYIQYRYCKARINREQCFAKFDSITQHCTYSNLLQYKTPRMLVAHFNNKSVYSTYALCS